jgi:hypothetical protein
MEKKHIITVIVIFVLGGLLFLSSLSKEEGKNEIRDDRGCLTSSGYSWDAEIEVCLIEGQFDSAEKHIAKMAADFNGRSKGLTVVDVVEEECDGCFFATLEEYGESTTINFEDWQVDTGAVSMVTFDEAKEMANGSDCVKMGILGDSYSYNKDTNTWWVDLVMKSGYERENCNPACVINEITKSAEINWRCADTMEY